MTATVREHLDAIGLRAGVVRGPVIGSVIVAGEPWAYATDGHLLVVVAGDHGIPDQTGLAGAPRMVAEIAAMQAPPLADSPAAVRDLAARRQGAL